MTALLLSLLACTDANTDDSTDDTADSQVNDDTGEEFNACEPSDQSVDQTGIYGLATDTDGGAIECMRAQFCTDVCVNGSSNGSGEFSVIPSAGGMGAFAVIPITDTYADYFTVGVPLEYSDADLEIDVSLPQMGTKVTIPDVAEPLELADNFTLTLGKDNFKGDFSTLNNDEAAVVRVGASAAPPHAPLPGTLVEMYHLAPWHGHAEGAEGIPVEIFVPNATEDYALYEFTYDAEGLVYEWTLVETTVSEQLISGSIHYLTTLAVVNTAVD